MFLKSNKNFSLTWKHDSINQSRLIYFLYTWFNVNFRIWELHFSDNTEFFRSINGINSTDEGEKGRLPRTVLGPLKRHVLGAWLLSAAEEIAEHANYFSSLSPTSADTFISDTCFFSFFLYFSFVSFFLLALWAALFSNSPEAILFLSQGGCSCFTKGFNYFSFIALNPRMLCRYPSTSNIYPYSISRLLSLHV